MDANFFAGLHKLNRNRFVDKIRNKLETYQSTVIIIPGGKSETMYDTDRDLLFRQESNFQWLFGVKEPDCFGMIDLEKNKSYLFIPRLSESYAVWMGPIKPPKYFRDLYQLDFCHHIDVFDVVIDELEARSVIMFPHLSNTVDLEKYLIEVTLEKCKFDIQEEIVNLRMIKTDMELELMHYVNKISSDAHKEVMKFTKPGLFEYQQESLFLHHCYTEGGCRLPAYGSICASGPNSAILHYGHAGEPNSRVIQDGDLCLLDMGAEYHCYASDITCTIPANGKFTEMQETIYNIVLTVQRTVMNAIRPYVKWENIHRLAMRIICQELRDHDFIQGELLDLIKHKIGEIFMPHSIGHHLGLDVHDVGTSGETFLKPNMVLTVEPGIYFIHTILEKALHDPERSQFLNEEKIREFWNFGGVRIEDDIVITETGIINLTKCPRTVQEIETFMAEN